MTDREAMRLALEALNSKYIVNCGAWMIQQDQAAEALRQTLAQNPLDIADRAYFAGKKDGIAETLAQPWDTSDMAHRTGGLSVEQEPVAWWTGKEKSEDEDFMYPKTRQSHIQHPNSATANFYPVPLYTAPPSKPEKEKESTAQTVDPRVLLGRSNNFTKETENRLCDIERRLAAADTQHALAQPEQDKDNLNETNQALIELCEALNDALVEVCSANPKIEISRKHDQRIKNATAKIKELT